MRINGLAVALDMALSAVGDADALRYRDALVLGALREDVRWIPLIGRVHEHLSFTHFSGRFLPGGFLPFLWAGPGTMADHFFERARELRAAGEYAAAYVQLGRAAHLLIDMACPVHAHRVAHESDPYEWFIEGAWRDLRSIPVPLLPAAKVASELVTGMARVTQAYAPDATQSVHGRWLKRLGLRRGLTREEAAEQARALIPQAAAHVGSLLKLFLQEAASTA